MKYLILTQDNAPTAHPLFDSLEAARAYFQAHSLDAPHHFIEDDSGNVYSLTHQICAHCGEPVAYCDTREQWVHIDPKAAPCFLVSQTL